MLEVDSRSQEETIPASGFGCGESENLWSWATRMQRSAPFSLRASPRALVLFLGRAAPADCQWRMPQSPVRVPAWIPEIRGVTWPRINELSTNYFRSRHNLVLQSSGVIAVFAEIVVMSK